MRRNIFLVVMILILGAVLNISWNFHEDKTQSNQFSDLIRFHVIANSDSDEDQELKLNVRNVLLEIIEPELAGALTLEEAMDFIANNLNYFEKAAEEEIKKWGYEYSIVALLGPTEYPTRSYGDTVLPAGSYQSLRIIIGDGKGSNWWCVLFPPLCFVDITNSIIKSETVHVLEMDELYKDENKTFKIKFKILEIIKDKIKLK